MLKDGTQTLTANIPFGGFKPTGLAAGVSSTDAATIGGSETLTNKTLTSPTLTSPTFTNPANTTQALTDGANIAWNMASGGVATVTLGGSRTMDAPTNIKTGGQYVLHITQDGTGGRTVTWNSVFKGHGGQAIASTQPIPTAGARSSFLFESPDGTNLVLIWSRIGSMQVFTGDGTYTPTAGMRYCKGTIVGGGGGGGGSQTNAGGSVSAGCGGGGGGASIKIISANTIGASQTVTIGAGGAAGSNAPTSGGTGGTTSLGSIITATGGTGGGGGTSLTTSQPSDSTTGGTGGVGSSGDVNFTGGGGGIGFQFASPNRVAAGFGGSSICAGGPPPLGSATSGAGSTPAATAYGAGASGAQTLGGVTGSSGGVGAAGICIVEEFF